MALGRVAETPSNSGNSNLGADNYTSASFTPANNSLLVIIATFITSSGSGSPGDLTITDSLGLTWTSKVTGTRPTRWGHGTRIWTTPITTGAAMTVTITLPGTNVQQFIIEPIHYTGYDTTTPTGATADGSNETGLGAPLDLTLSAAPAATSEVIAVAARCDASGGDRGILHGTGWTEMYQNRYGSWQTVQSQRRSGSTSTTVRWDNLNDTAEGTGTNPYCFQGVALEIREAAGGGGGGGTAVISANTGADYTGVVDGHIKESTATTSYMSGAQMETTSYASGDRTLTLIEFAVPSLGPLTLSAVNFEMYLESADAGSHTIDIHKLLRDIASGTTWNLYDGTNSWATAGGLNAADRDATALDSQAINTTTGYKSWSSSALLTYVESCLNTGTPIRFWIMRNPTTAYDFTYRTWTTSEGTDGRRPRLTFTWTPANPEMLRTNSGKVLLTNSGKILRLAA